MLAVAVTVAVLVSGCSSPGLFPVILNDPPPRADTTFTPAEVKQATDNLISERNHLCAETGAGDRRPSADVAANCSPADFVTTGATQTAGAGGRP